MGRDRIPTELDECAAVWRSWLSGRRTLLLLDNAYDDEQIRFLRPGPRAVCLTLVSSRRQNIDADLRINAAPLAQNDAVELLLAVGRQAAGTGTQHARTLTALAHRGGLLPLTLRPVAAMLRSVPADAVLEAMAQSKPLVE